MRYSCAVYSVPTRPTRPSRRCGAGSRGSRSTCACSVGWCRCLEAWIADEGLDYRYSGIDHVARPWTPPLATLRDRVAQAAGSPFNSVLCNLYRTGDDGVDWHADDEVEFGRLPVIASLSLGATRRFDLRRVDDPDYRLSVELHHGDLLVMRGTTQELWRHRVPKTRAQVDERINLTFRQVLRRR